MALAERSGCDKALVGLPCGRAVTDRCVGHRPTGDGGGIDNTWQDGSMRCIGTVAGGRAAKPSLRRRRVRDRFWTHSHASQIFWRNDGGTVQSPARTSSHRACCTEAGKGSVSPVTRTRSLTNRLEDRLYEIRQDHARRPGGTHRPARPRRRQPKMRRRFGSH